MITPNGGVFGRNPTFNDVTVDGNLTVNGDIALGDDIVVTDTLTVTGATTLNGGLVARPNASAPTSNVTIGPSAGAAMDATTDDSIAIGRNALLVSTTDDVVAIGSEALDANTLGTANVAVGRSALGAATTAIGTFTTTPVAAGSGYTANQTGVTVTLVKKSGADTFTGTVQAALTTNASGAVTAVQAAPVSAGSTFTGTNVIFEPSGFGAGSGCEISIATLATAASNTAVGHQAGLSLTTASECTFVGASCGDAVTTAVANTGVGASALGGTTTGTSNTAVGRGALQLQSIGLSNTAVGDYALYASTSSANCAVGALALFNMSSGSNVTALGYAAGRFRGSGSDTLTSATSSVFIGHQSRANGNAQPNQVVIAGTDGLGDGSNTTVIGNTSTTQARLFGATFLSTGANGQSTQLGQATTLLSGLTGATVTATNLIPANSILLGVTARVTTAITGATTFDIGDGVTADRFGNDVAIALGTTSNQVIAPAAFAAANNVVLTANGSNFTDGAVRLTAHFMTLVAPTS